MKLVISDVQSAIDQLKNATTSFGDQRFNFGNIGAKAFSQVSGLDESGSMHGTIRSDSEPEATKGLAQHFANAVDLLSAQLVGYEMADMSFADVLGSVGQSVMGRSFNAVIDNLSLIHISEPTRRS